MRTYKILVEAEIEAKDKEAARVSFLNGTKYETNVKFTDILYVKPCKKEESKCPS